MEGVSDQREIASDLWEIRSNKWMRILWHSIHMSWKSVDLRIKHTRGTQDGKTSMIVSMAMIKYKSSYYCGWSNQYIFQKYSRTMIWI